MSAPLIPGASGNRDLFAAYLCDEASLGVLRAVVTELGWQAEKYKKGGLNDAIQSLSRSPSPNILMVDLSESDDPLNDINALAEVCEAGTVVITIGQMNDVRLYRDLLANGIHDYLLKPLSPSILRDALNAAQAALMTSRGNEDDQTTRYISTAIIGTRGGVGASTIATSLAWIYAEKHMPTALFDLDVHFGTGALTLDLEPGRGLTDAINNPSRIDGLFIERAMVHATDTLAVLSAEAPIDLPLTADNSAFSQLQEEFHHVFEMTVIDMPRNMLINFPPLLNEVNVVTLVVEMTLASARDTIRILSWLKANAAHAQTLVVANKVAPATAEISKADFEASIERPIDILIPLDQKAAIKAAKLGKAFVHANNSSKASTAIQQLSSRIIGPVDKESNGATELASNKKSLLGNFDIKALLTKKLSSDSVE